MMDPKYIDLRNSSTFEASYCTMTTSYQIMGPLTEDNALHVVYLGMRDDQGRYIEVPCTYVAAELIRLYDAGTLLTLYVSPRVETNSFGDLELIPLVVGAVRAL